MQTSDYFSIGKIVRKYSYKGEVIIKIDNDFIEFITDSEPIFVATDNHLIPFFMEKMVWHKPCQLRVKFEDVDSDTEADTMIHSKVYLPKVKIPENSGKNFYKVEIIGFKVEDINLGYVGKVEKVNDTTPQRLLEVLNKNDRVLIPVNDAFIKKIDRENKLIVVETPEGLLDLRY